MIVRRIDDVIQLITQPDHAHLARRVMEHCTRLRDRPRLVAILHAIDEHDCGWAEADAAPIVNPDTGTVVDFVNAPLSVRQAGAPRAIEKLATDPWAAALVAQHGLTVYHRFRSEAEWTSYFAEMEAVRATMLVRSGLTLDALVADYAFVRLGDLISLAFCTAGTEEQRFDEWTIRFSGSRVRVTPDPFGGAPVPIAIDALEIPSQRFRSDAALRDALSNARTTTVRGDAAGDA